MQSFAGPTAGPAPAIGGRVGNGDDGGPLAVEARSVTVEYERSRGKSTLVALEDFSVDIRSGEFLTIVGPSGCGKSTFLKILLGRGPIRPASQAAPRCEKAFAARAAKNRPPTTSSPAPKRS